MIRQLAILTLITGGFLSCTSEQPRYLQLHQAALVADMHCDGVLKIKKGLNYSIRNNDDHMDIPRLKEGGTDLQVFACWVATDTPPEECRPKVDEMIDSLEAMVDQNPDDIAICLTADQADSIIRQGKIAAFLSVENGVAIAEDLLNLEHYYNRGIRYMTLTHTASSDWIISSADTAPAFNGLSDFGRAVVWEMNKLGMIIDVSHASAAAIEQVIKYSKAPVIASHSCVHALCPHDRNLTDAQIEAIASKGGVIGINYFNGYISSRWNHVLDSLYETRRAEIDSLDEYFYGNDSLRNVALEPIWDDIAAKLDTIEVTVGDAVDHIDYIVKLVGADYVGLGSGWDGVFAMPTGLDDCTMVPNITRELVSRGYKEEDIRKILGGNFMRVFRQVCGGA